MTDWPTMSFTTGPLEMADQTIRDQSRQIVFHQDPAFVAFFDRTCEMLRRVYRTRHDVVIQQGEALLGLESAAASLIAPGDKVLNVVSGPYAKWYEDFIRKYGGDVIELAVPYDAVIDPEDVRRALRAHPGVKLLSAVHSDTPCGTVNPIGDIGRIAREHGVLTIVDTVCGLGGEDLCPEEDGIDLAVAGPHKFLSGPPGLSLLAVSPAAWAAMEKRPAPVRGSYLSILDWRDSWIAKRSFPHSPSVADIYALESCLRQALDEGLDRLRDRHRLIARAARAAVAAMDLRLWPARESYASASVTAVRAPAGLTDQAIRTRLRERYGVMISPSSGYFGAEIFRMAHMGKVAHPTYLCAQLAMIERTLADLGHRFALGAGVGAALAVLGDWTQA